MKKDHQAGENPASHHVQVTKNSVYWTTECGEKGRHLEEKINNQRETERDRDRDGEKGEREREREKV